MFCWVSLFDFGVFCSYYPLPFYSQIHCLVNVLWQEIVAFTFHFYSFLYLPQYCFYHQRPRNFVLMGKKKPAHGLRGVCHILSCIFIETREKPRTKKWWYMTKCKAKESNYFLISTLDVLCFPLFNHCEPL